MGKQIKNKKRDIVHYAILSEFRRFGRDNGERPARTICGKTEHNCRAVSMSWDRTTCKSCLKYENKVEKTIKTREGKTFNNENKNKIKEGASPSAVQVPA